MKDRSLDEFLDAGDETDGASDSEPADGAETVEAAVPDAADAEATTARSEDAAGADPAPSSGAATDVESGASSTPAQSSLEQGTGESPDETVAGDSSSPAAEPAQSTYAWDGDGGVCGDCGATVSRRWRQGEALVCPECKDW